MVGLTERIDENGRPLINNKAAISDFCYESGFVLSATDMGNQGVKIALVHESQDGGAIVLPPKKAEECGKWLLQTIGQRSYDPLKELSGILKRLMREKALGQMLQRGDKKKIREAIRLLKIQQS
ncbi:MAG: hypothetical protein ACYTBJ_17995 [Planctomycetota bacterium]|jgi:hypothetical protein